MDIQIKNLSILESDKISCSFCGKSLDPKRDNYGFTTNINFIGFDEEESEEENEEDLLKIICSECHDIRIKLFFGGLE